MPIFRRGPLWSFLLVPLMIAACASPPPSAMRSNVRQLLALQKSRLDVAITVARSKWNSGAPIDDPVREGIILDDVAQRARNLGLDEQWTRRFFQDQFDAGKLVQRDLHRQWRQEQRPPFANPPDLGREVRPVLDRLTPELLAMLTQLQGRQCDPSVTRALHELTPRILGEAYPAPVQNKAIEALRCD
ncbi:gamma subclass chorismate mutase AroQ [Herbaspirillum sp. YR522]|uniref:gamma subclass chorismate mutase AroQ n=1 Tax=Herbaspirillum sp. YR522 TaxID=1144342 RepID=UPI00026F9A24|nr:gamma subclass chorismate mutase AroQ [Herbaspirillum sp. YR522]EJN00911.1 chorismate mutase, putative [Herbaspirillum sp. YR522]